MQMNFHKKYTGISKPTLAIETRNDGINQMSLNNALNTLHNKMNILEKAINENNKEEHTINESTSHNHEKIIFDLEKKLHDMEKQIEELYQNFDSLQVKFNNQQELISKHINSNIEKMEEIEETTKYIPNDDDLKNMIKPLIELDSINNVLSDDDTIETTDAVQNYSEATSCISLYDISYEYFIDSALLDDINEFQDDIN